MFSSFHFFLATEDYSCLSSSNKFTYNSGFFCNYSSLYARMHCMFVGLFMLKENKMGC